MRLSTSLRAHLGAAAGAFLLAGAVQAMPATPAAPLGTDLPAMQAEERLVGAVVALVDGRADETLALGRFHNGSSQPLQAEHRVMVGSVAKPVLALAVLRLVSQGRLDLDAPLATVLPQLALRNPWAARSPVRVRHLLDMTSGLPDVQLWHVFNAGHSAQQPLAAALRPELGPLVLRTEPGRQFGYSNLGFTVAAMVIEAVTGEGYETWVERELLLPLGMTSSRLHFRTQADDPRLAWGHIDDGQPVAERPVAPRPAMQFATTAGDMRKLMHFLLGDGRVPGADTGAGAAGEAFIRPALMAALGRPQSTDAARAGLASGYGLGFFTRDRHGAVGLCHGGSVAGWKAMLCVFRAQRRGFFIAFNSDREDADYNRFDARLVQHLGVAIAPAAVVAADTAAQAAWNGWYLPAPSRLELMRLGDRLLGFWRLQVQPGRATLQQGLAAPRLLLPAGALFRQADRVQPTLVLLRDDDRRPQLGGGHITLRRVALWELVAGWAVAVLGAAAALAALPLVAWHWYRGGAVQALRRAPAAGGLLIFAAALAAWVVRGWPDLGSPGPVAWAVAAGSVALVLGALLQLWQAARCREPGAWLDAAIALGLLGLCALLALHDLWPLRPDLV
jgi:CubicO group peptidase (beta-lactamase class C family)